MATAKLEEVKNNFLTCVVCHEIFTDPCTLNCQHSFCRKCLTQFTKTQRVAVRSKKIPCPTCRQVTWVPDPSRPVDEWAGQFKAGYVVQGLLDTMTCDMKLDASQDSTSCSLCHRLGEVTPNAFWCYDCEVSLCHRCLRMHLINPASSDHIYSELISKKRVSKTPDELRTERTEMNKMFDRMSTPDMCKANLPTGRTEMNEQMFDRMSSPDMRKTMDCEADEDKDHPGVYDVVIFNIDGMDAIVVTDYNNKCLKSFYIGNNKRCHSRLLLDNKPWGIAQLKDNQVIVAVPFSRQIVTVAVTPDLVLLSTISTSKKYYIISMLGSSSLAAGCYKCVDILNMEGQVMNSVTTHNNADLFTYPRYMCVSNKGHLLVSDWDKQTVTCLTSEGDVMWIYSSTGEGELRSPTGITTTSGGDILVVDRDLRKVIQLSEFGKRVRDVLTSKDGLIKPFGICVDEEGSIFVCEGKHMKILLY